MALVLFVPWLALLSAAGAAGAAAALTAPPLALALAALFAVLSACCLGAALRRAAPLCAAFSAVARP